MVKQDQTSTTQSPTQRPEKPRKPEDEQMGANDPQPRQMENTERPQISPDPHIRPTATPADNDQI